MKIPSVLKAEEYLKEASLLNPGQWIEHSKNVALAAKSIASNVSLNPESAYILGLLHDIGRRQGKMQARHIIEGYKFMLLEGYEDCARICMTHTFQYKDINAIYDVWDNVPEEDIILVKNYIRYEEYDDYDLLIQLCDSLTLDEVYCVIEKKMVSSVIKNGIKGTTINKWKAIFDVKNYFDAKAGKSVYELLPCAPIL